MKEKDKKQRQKGTMGCYVESVRAKWFCCAFKLDFPNQLFGYKYDC